MGELDGLVPSLGSFIAAGLQQGLEDLHNSVRATTSTLFGGEPGSSVRTCTSCGRPSDEEQKMGRNESAERCAQCVGGGVRGGAGAGARGGRGGRHVQPVSPAAMAPARSARLSPWQGGGGAGVRGADLNAILHPLSSQARTLCYKQVGPMSMNFKGAHKVREQRSRMRKDTCGMRKDACGMR
jgi:hypothetical protein